MVGQTIDSIALADYPRDRLEIFVIDDGSKDDTWDHIFAAAQRHPDLVTPVRFTENRGKRAALEVGFTRAKGEIAVTIDSDSVIEKQTLLEIAGPFRNPKVGAVAGKVAAFNRRSGIIPRMLHVRFILSFDSIYIRNGILLPWRAVCLSALGCTQSFTTLEPTNFSGRTLHLWRRSRHDQFYSGRRT